MDSIWSKTCRIPRREKLKGAAKTQAAVIGAGMAGILIASALQEAGAEVSVLEAERIAGGQSRNTTAKITSQHGLIYQRLISDLGREKARQYAMANQEAVDSLRRLASDKQIDCDIEERSSYVYGNSLEQLEAETEAARSLGLPASFREGGELPVPAAGAVAFSAQAQFHPLKFIRALSEKLTIYEGRITGEFQAGNADKREISYYMTGGRKEEQA